MTGYENNMIGSNTQQRPIQYPYNNVNNLYNTPYMGQQNGQMMNQFLKCRPVSSREQAMAFQIDLDGSLWVFPNVGNGKIYTKQINNDGTATFSTYTFTKNENPFNSSEYVTKDELNQVVKSIMAAISPVNSNPGVVSAASNIEQKPMDF